MLSALKFSRTEPQPSGPVSQNPERGRAVDYDRRGGKLAPKKLITPESAVLF